jgi:hypothetical protein
MNICILLGIYICGAIAAGSFNLFNWAEGVRTAISLFYGTIATLSNAIVSTEYKSESK